MSYTVNVNPKEVIKTIAKVNILCLNVLFFESARFMVEIFADTGENLSRSCFDLTKEEYLAWQNNDEYIINLMCSKVGLTPVVEPEPQMISSTIE
jgi:hypothetical protein